MADEIAARIRARKQEFDTLTGSWETNLEKLKKDYTGPRPSDILDVDLINIKKGKHKLVKDLENIHALIQVRREEVNKLYKDRDNAYEKKKAAMRDLQDFIEIVRHTAMQIEDPQARLIFIQRSASTGDIMDLEELLERWDAHIVSIEEDIAAHRRFIEKANIFGDNVYRTLTEKAYVRDEKVLLEAFETLKLSESTTARLAKMEHMSEKFADKLMQQERDRTSAVKSRVNERETQKTETTEQLERRAASKYRVSSMFASMASDLERDLRTDRALGSKINALKTDAFSSHVKSPNDKFMDVLNS